MSRNYNLDPKAAAEAASGGKIVKQSGLYPGLIKFSWGSVNKNNNEAVHVIVECDNGQLLNQDFWTYDAKGEALPSLKMVNALMACVSTRTLTPTPGSVTRYDYDAGQDMPFTEDTYPELMGKRAIFAVQMEAYVGNDNKDKTRPVIVGVYDANTRMNAAEKLAKATEAKAIDAQARWLAENPLQQAKARAVMPNRAAPGVQGSAPQKGAGGAFDDDVPFAPLSRRQHF